MEETWGAGQELSQARTRSVLEYGFSIDGLYSRQQWARAIVTANGLSYSKSLKDKNGIEIPEDSRRVEFRVRTNSEKKIEKIIQRLK